MNYTIEKEPFSVLSCVLETGECLKCQKGAMIWRSPDVKMRTKAGGLGRMIGRSFAHESAFFNTYQALDDRQEISFGMRFPGTILPVEVTDGNIIAQKSAFLVCEDTVDMRVYFQKRIGVGFFGGEGFIMQRFVGNGLAFLEIDGACVERMLAAGEELYVGTGNLAAMEDSCRMELETVKGVGNVLLGGEGLFLTRITGPGKVWLQTMPIGAFGMALEPYIQKK